MEPGKVGRACCGMSDTGEMLKRRSYHELRSSFEPFEGRCPDVSARLEDLRTAQNSAYWNFLEILDLSTARGMAPVDLVLFGLTTRALETVEAFDVLLRRWNVIAAANEVRSQLDNLMRLNLLWHVEPNSDAFAALLQGERLNTVTDPTRPDSKAKLTDQRLRELALNTYPWIDHYYEEASRWVHYSGRHLGVAMQFGEPQDDGSIPFNAYIPPRPDSYDLSSIGDMLEAFISVTEALATLLGVWAEAKRSHASNQ